jgi:hypothetical protein
MHNFVFIEQLYKFTVLLLAPKRGVRSAPCLTHGEWHMQLRGGYDRGGKEVRRDDGGGDERRVMDVLRLRIEEPTNKGTLGASGAPAGAAIGFVTLSTRQ